MEEDDLPGEIGVVKPDGGAGRAHPVEARPPLAVVPRWRQVAGFLPSLDLRPELVLVPSPPPLAIKGRTDPALAGTPEEDDLRSDRYQF